MLVFSPCRRTKTLPNPWLRKLYDASISVTPDGSLLVSSTQDRVLAWGLLFCLLAAACLTVYLVRRGRRSGRFALGTFGLSLLIPVFIMPSVRHEYIHVTPEKITIDNGAWYLSSRTVVPVNAGDRIHEKHRGFLPSNLIGDPAVDWHFRRHNGERDILELNAYFNAHRMVVAYYFKDRGFRVRRLEEQ